MDPFYLIAIIISLSVSALLRAYFFHPPKPTLPLPPGPPYFPIISNFLWIRKSLADIEPILRSLTARFGPVVTLRVGSFPTIFVADRSLAHQALVQNGAVFADRPPATATDEYVTSNKCNISSSSYGPKWRLLRRNLTAEILHPSRVKSYSHARKWVLQLLLSRLQCHAVSGDPVGVSHHFQFAMFCLLVLMCFGDKLDQTHIEKIEKVEQEMLTNVTRFNVLNYFPRLTKILFRKQ